MVVAKLNSPSNGCNGCYRVNRVRGDDILVLLPQRISGEPLLSRNANNWQSPAVRLPESQQWQV